MANRAIMITTRRYPNMKVIFHIDELKKWELTIGNVKNMLLYGKENHEAYTIEIVANAEAVEYLCHRNDEFQAVMEKLSEDGVSITACHHALMSRGISNGELYSFVEVVPAGVVELAKKQQEGYSYIKP